MQAPIHSLLNSEGGGGAEGQAFHFHTAQGTVEATMTLKAPPAPKTSLLRAKTKKSALKSETHGKHLPHLVTSLSASSNLIPGCKGLHSARKLLGTITEI